MKINRKLTVSLLLAFTMACSVTGCIPGEKTEETETEAEIFYVPDTDEIETETEMETESETEIETERETEPAVTLFDIRAGMTMSGYYGSAEYEIIWDGVSDGNFSYQADAGAFLATLDNGETVYSGTDKTIYSYGNTWNQCREDYVNMMALINDGACVMEDPVSIGGTPCYRVSLAFQDDISAVNGIIGAAGCKSPVIGETTLTFYVTDSFDLIRIDMASEFVSDGKTGNFTCVMSCTSSSEVSVTAPETEAEDLDDFYVPGSIESDKNVYYNHYFDIQAVGGSLLKFDIERTAELKDEYEESGSSYIEEAYASGNGTILNISTLKTDDGAAEVLDKYMTDSGAEAVSDGENLETGENIYSSRSAVINQTDTVTYCTSVDGRALLMTLYYEDPASVETFESELYGIDEDPEWLADSWTLSGTYVVTTPSGFYIDPSCSSDVYVRMTKDNGEVNVFLYKDRTLEEEAEAESVSNDSLTREVLENEDVSTDDGGVMKYLVVRNIAADYEYYTYLGLVQNGSDLLEYYVVETQSDSDYKSVFADFCNNVETLDEPAYETLPDGENAETEIQEEN